MNKIQIPWEDRPVGCTDVMWRYSQNPVIGRYHIPSSNSIFNSAVVPFEDGFAGVFRCDNKAVQMNIFAGFSKDGIHWDINHGLYPSGNRVTDKPEILFARLDLKEVLEKVEKLHPKKEEPKEEAEEEKTENVIDIEAKPEITFDDFEKLQFQVGEIIACEEVKKSRKLLCSQVKIGSQVRQIVSGIKAHYSAEEMVGKKVMVVTNLKPAKLAGILSEGMILCAEDADGNLSLMVPEKEMPAGAEIC